VRHPLKKEQKISKIVGFGDWSNPLKIRYTEKEWLFSTGLHTPANSLKIE
jgi:hypothetical protein